MSPKRKTNPPIEPIPGKTVLHIPDLMQDNGDIFALMVNSIREYAIFLTDPNGYIKSWNAGANNIKWYEPAEIIGRHIAVFYTAEDTRDGVPEANLQHAVKYGNYECEGWRVRKGGSLFWASVVFTALYNKTGSLIGFAKVTRDITRQKRAEEKISHLANLIDKTSDAIYSLDASRRIVSWNKAAQAMYGYNAEEVLLKPAEEIIGADITVENRADLRQSLEAKDFWNGELRHTKKGGALFWALISVTVSRDAEGNIDEFVCICRDVTTLRKNETERKELAEKIENLTREKLNYSLREIADYRHALDRSSIVAITDANGIITYANENFCDVSKYKAPELIGQDHRIVNSGHHSKEFMRQMWHTIQGGEVWKGEIKNKTKDGEFYWVDTTIVPFVDQHSKPHQYLAIGSDITEKKHAEKELTILNEQLELRVEERTRLLEEANKELESFSYSVSHDLRAPLRAINGYSKMVQEDYGLIIDDEGKRLFNEIADSAKKMGQLIDDLLKFSRLGRRGLSIGEIDMQQMVQNCLDELLGDTSGRHTIEVGSLPPCTGDANLIKQVWLNFIGNAIKYSSKTAEPKITIGSSTEKSATVYYVKDNGVGFDKQYAHKLFGVFQRLHNSNDFEGTGVGLALVKRIISKHYGSVWAEGEVNKGAEFYFSLPAKK